MSERRLEHGVPDVATAYLVAPRQRCEIDVSGERRPRRMHLHSPDLSRSASPGISKSTCVRMRRSNARSKLAARFVVKITTP